MKPILSIIIVMILAISLFSCGDKPKPTVTPPLLASSNPNTPSENVDNNVIDTTETRLVHDEAASVKNPTGKINADLQKRILNGEIVKLKDGDCIDLNDDGVGEVIHLDRVIPEDSYHHKVTLTIGNRKITKEMTNSTGEFYAGMLGGYPYRGAQILIHEEGPSGDPYNHIFHYQNSRIWDCDGVPGFAEHIKITSTGFTGTTRSDMLQTWYRPADYVFCSAFVLNERQEKEFIPPQVKEIPRPIYPLGTTVVLLQDLILRDSKEPNSSTTTVKKGSKVCIVATDDVEWALISPYEDYYRGWLRLKKDSFNMCINGDKLIDSQQLFDGLFYAD